MFHYETILSASASKKNNCHKNIKNITKQILKKILSNCHKYTKNITKQILKKILSPYRRIMNKYSRQYEKTKHNSNFVIRFI